jgi:hypothetical protein
MHDSSGAEDQDRSTEEAPETEGEPSKRAILRLVMEIFPGARWTTREEYRRAAAQRDRQGRSRRG